VPKTKIVGGIETVDLSEVLELAKSSIMPEIEAVVDEALAEAFAKYIGKELKAEDDEDEDETEGEIKKGEGDAPAKGDDDEDDDDEEEEEEAEGETEGEKKPEEKPEDAPAPKPDGGDDAEGKIKETPAAKSVDADAIVERIVKQLGAVLDAKIESKFKSIEVVRIGKRSVLRQGGDTPKLTEKFDFSKVTSVDDVPDEILASLSEDDMRSFGSLAPVIRKALLAKYIRMRSTR